MTEALKQQIEQYVAWIRANGVDVTPTISTAEYTPVDGYVPPTYIDWKNGRGTILRQGVGIIFNGGDDFTEELFEVQNHLGIDNHVRIKWADWVNPRTSGYVEIAGDPVIGQVFDADRRLFNAAGFAIEGATYTQPITGRRFVCVATGMFDRKWQEI